MTLVMFVGVMISHGNLLCGMSGQCERVPGLGWVWTQRLLLTLSDFS